MVWSTPPPQAVRYAVCAVKREKEMSKDSSAIVDATIQHRRSTRAFRPEPVPNELVSHILEVASRAPSGCNTQPWRVHVLMGAARQNIVDTVCHAFETEPQQHVSEYQHTPEEFFEPFLSRRRKMGFRLYELADIPKGDKERMRIQQRRNYTFLMRRSDSSSRFTEIYPSPVSSALALSWKTSWSALKVTD